MQPLGNTIVFYLWPNREGGRKRRKISLWLSVALQVVGAIVTLSCSEVNRLGYFWLLLLPPVLAIRRGGGGHH